MRILQDIVAETRHFTSAMRRPRFRQALAAEMRTFASGLPGILPWLPRFRETSTFTLLSALQAHAAKTPNGIALLVGDERVTFRELDARTSQYAHVLSRAGAKVGSRVVLLGSNSTEYVAWILAATRVGAVAALINTNLTAAPLAHAIRAAKTDIAVVQDQFASRLPAAFHSDNPLREVLVYGNREFEQRAASVPNSPFPPARVQANSDFVYIYTSGTTGLPKPSRVTHARTLLMGASMAHFFFRFRPHDRVYIALPLYHSSGLLLGIGGSLAGGVPAVIRESFSASNFWPDVRRYEATCILYIGELARYLLERPPLPNDRDHKVRVAVGNGMREDLWKAFRARFGIQEIREFYGATEAPGALANFADVPGSVGRIPLRRIGSFRLVKFDIESENHVRDGNGFCIPCDANEVGELLVRLGKKNEKSPLEAAVGFRGYTDEIATQKKILEDVFERGDRYYRTGDLLRVDEDDFWYFVDRIGDTFRFKGENVATTEVAAVIERCRDVRGATVFGLPLRGVDGQVGVAAIEATPEHFDWADFARVVNELPAYARPQFVRVTSALSTTGTLKVTKASLRAEGVDPRRVQDPIFFLRGGTYVKLDGSLYEDIMERRVRL